MIPFITDFFNGLKDFSDSYWFYVIILAIAILDSVFPIVPSETLVIIGGVSAGSGSLSLGLVMACAFGGALPTGYGPSGDYGPFDGGAWCADFGDEVERAVSVGVCLCADL